jgi:hypothetical protein
MPYRIKARNAKGNSVTMLDMRNPAPITDKQHALLLAEEWANRQLHQGPWTGYVEYYDAADSIQAPDQSTRQEQILSKLTAKRRGVDA